jgi:hypothetical protein
LTIIVSAASYTQLELDSAASQLLDNAQSKGLPVTGVGVMPDTSGLSVSLSPQSANVLERTKTAVASLAVAPVVEWRTAEFSGGGKLPQ